MNKIVCVLLVALFSPFLVDAQVRLYTQEDRKGNKVLISENKDFFSYSVIIDLIEFENLDTREVSGRYFIAKPGKNVLAKMKVKDSKKESNLEFNSQIVRGKYNPDFKDKIPFLLPVKEGLEVKVSKVISDGVVSYDDLDKKSAGVLIHFNEPTFICAPRKGIVTKIVDGSASGFNQIDFDEEDNYIEFYHEDGTFSRLYVFKSKTLRIKVGDTVYPGMELAESAVLNQQSEPYVRFVRLLTIREGYEFKQRNEEVAFVSSANSSLKPENGFKMISVHPERWIMSEMTKKEIKKYLPLIK
ncbi:M23 family metallopeptidase [Belliella sp. DSM 107340]|uniref:M23 family metallopeptidase n=1 Tax=Belliella calami TaxID=2923436 RepID=A0ABS9UL47_9BACT|nr:M23 family metallopeptidase [Belliella calami]MCH7397352.1 M23 family metallopeptidase [Belliella calami]